MDPDFLRPEASAYLDSLLPAVGPVLARLQREAQAEGQPASNPHTGALLRVLVGASGGKRVVEVGTNIGVGSLWLLAGMPASGQLDTIEMDPAMVARARRNIAEAGESKRVTVHEGAALEVLPRLVAPYDFCYIDCVKSEYTRYLEHALRLVRPGGIIAADNMLWHGQPWDPDAVDESTQGIRAYTHAIRAHPRLRSSVVPTGDGLAASVVLG